MKEIIKMRNNLRNKKIVFMGTPEFSIPTLKALHEYTDVIAVITQMDSRSGRGKAYKPTPVKEAALGLGLPVYQFEKVNSPEAKEFLNSLEIDFIVVVAYGQILKKWLIDLPKYAILNVHASLLPKLRGAAPIQRAILEDFKETGITIMKIDEGLDTGDMFSKVKVNIEDHMDFGMLHDILKSLGTDALLQTMSKIVEGEVIAVPQNSDEASYAAMIKKSEAKIDWNNSGRMIFNLIRGFSPYMGAFSTIDGKRFKIMKALYFSSSDVKNMKILNEKDLATFENGSIIIENKLHLYVKVRDGLLEILEIQPENAKKMHVDVFLRGYRVEGLRFE